MSQIAGFYAVPDSAVAQIRNAALPQKAGWFGKTTDTFWQTLWSHAGRDRLNFEGSGYAFVVLFEYLRDRKLLDVEGSENEEFARLLSSSRKAYFLSFTPAQARELAQSLPDSQGGEDDLKQYVVEFCGPEEPETMTAAVLAAARILRPALDGLQPGTIGLLNIG